MKLFARSGGYWLFWVSALYFIAGAVDLFVYDYIKQFEIVQAVYVVVLGAPLFIKPLARWLNMNTLWEM